MYTKYVPHFDKHFYTFFIQNEKVYIQNVYTNLSKCGIDFV